MRFWLIAGLLIVGGGIAALVVFLVFSAALLKWGFLGAIILIGAVALGVAWVMDRRRQREYEELEEAV